MKKILFIIGSLRKDSFNRKLAEEAERMPARKVTVELEKKFCKENYRDLCDSLR